MGTTKRYRRYPPGAAEGFDKHARAIMRAIQNANGHSNKCALTAASQRAGFGNQRVLPNHLQILTTVMGYLDSQHVPFTNPRSLKRPFVAWGGYYDDSGHLKTIDCLNYKARPSPYASDLNIEGDRLIQLSAAGKLGRITLSHVLQLPNDKQHFRSHILGYVSPVLVPDFILRRVQGILHNKGPKDIGLRELPEGLIRKGFVFNTVRQAESRSGDFVPEAFDAQINQEPFTIPKYLDQEDIDDICRIARHYGEYCIERALPIIWPKPGTYGRWPKEFLQFVEPQEHASLPWLQRTQDNSGPTHDTLDPA